MNDLLEALRDPAIPMLRDALWTGLCASVALGIVGTYVVTRRISSIAGAISHSVLGGIGAALYLRTVAGWWWCDPLLGAVVAALAAAVIIGLVSLYAKQREDTVIGALWAAGMAVGLLFFAKTPGYADPMSYLFGNILTITPADLRHVLLLDVLVVALGLLFYHKFFAVCFDQEFAELRGVRVRAYYLLLLCLTALTVVLLVRVVGIVMVIAMLTLPAAIAGHFSRQLWQMMIVAVLVCMALTTVGLGLSYRLDAPSGPVIIVLSAAVYLAVVLARRCGTRRGA
jgi:zinc transport system permease protein